MTKALKLGLASAVLALAMPMQAGADSTGSRSSNHISEEIPTFAEFESQCRANTANSTDCSELFDHGAEYTEEAMDASSCNFTAFWAARDGASIQGLSDMNWDVAIGQLIDMGACVA